jgi:hypothetical protein
VRRSACAAERLCRTAQPEPSRAAPATPAPEQVPDFESAGACWVSLAQLEGGAVPIRSASELSWLWRVAAAGTAGSGAAAGGGREVAAAVVLPMEMPAAWAATFAGYQF